MFCKLRNSIRCSTDFLNYRTFRNMKSVKLQGTEQEMPTVGLGTWQASANEIESTVTRALNLGYRLIDTAFNYNNEEAIGIALKKWLQQGKGSRKDLFVTTKLPHIANRPQDVKKFLKLQLERLQLDYVDLYLIHVPFSFVCNPKSLTPKLNLTGEYELDMQTNHMSTWQALEECQKEGLACNLGLSNFNIHQIKSIIQTCQVKPQVLQVEVHAYFQQNELRTYCAQNGIVVMAYGPLGSPGAKDHFVNKYNYSPDAFPDLLGHPTIKQIAEKHQKTSAQVLLRFLVQQQVVVIPKSISEARLKENLDIFDFELRPSEMNILKKLDKGDTGRIFNFLFWKGVENHPQYPFTELLPQANLNKI